MVTKPETSMVDRNEEIDLEESITPSCSLGGIIRRNRPGTSAKQWCDWPEQDLEEMESTLAVQQVNQI